MGRNDESRRLQFQYSFLPDVERRIDVAVMFNTAFRASPDAFMKWHFRHLVTTTMTRFRTGKPLVEFYQVSAFFRRLVLQPCDEAMPACITYHSCQIVVFHHVGCFQRLDNYRLIVRESLC